MLQFSIALLCTICICTEGTKQELVDAIQIERRGNGIAPNTDRLKSYSEMLEGLVNFPTKVPDLATVQSLSAFYLARKNVAVQFGSTNWDENELYSKVNLQAIVQKVAEINRYFLLDEDYIAVAIKFDTKVQEDGTRFYALIFAISNADVKQRMAERIRRLKWAKNKDSLNYPFERLNKKLDEKLNKMAASVKPGDNSKPNKFDAEIHTMVNVVVPISNTTSWNKIMQYLLIHGDDGKGAAQKIFDPLNESMGVHLNWNFDTTNKDLVTSLHVVMIFEKMKTTGRQGVYQYLLKKIKDVRKQKSVANDLLKAVLYPDTKANEVATDIAVKLGEHHKNGIKNYEGETPFPARTTGLVGFAKYDAAKGDTKAYEILTFNSSLDGWIDEANKNTDAFNRLYYSSYNKIGFGSTLVVDKKTGIVYWHFCVLFYY